MLGIATLLVLVIGPLALGATGLVRAMKSPVNEGAGPGIPWNWTLTVASTLLFVLAFNLTFFIQELFLVLPKAFTPGLRPTLYHNNHGWEGENPLASLFQGTGALAILITGVACAVSLRWRRDRSAVVRLLLFWMAYNGLFQALPQIVVGAVNPHNDVGMAMNYLQLGETSKLVAAYGALFVIPVAALWLLRPLLECAEQPAQVTGPRARTRFVFLVAALPALIAVSLIIPFRVPRELLKVLAPPILVAVIGMIWIQAAAWRVRDVTTVSDSSIDSVSYPLAAVVALLLIFQVVLRPGIPFH